MSRWLVTGAGGMLGRDLCHVLQADPGIKLTAHDKSTLDITDPAAVHTVVSGMDVVINTAAWTDVDRAETEPEAAEAVNGTAVANLAQACATTGTRLIHISTDYVFDGSSTTPYAENASTQPINAYGRSKLTGEHAVLHTLPDNGYVVRTAWLYGEHGRNFVATMLRLAGSRPRLEVVNDQWGQPTWTVALCRQLANLGRASHAPPGIYHGTSSGTTTWYQLAVAAFEHAGLDPDRITPVGATAFPRPAPRPAYSALSHEKWAAAGLEPQPDWRSQLAAAFAAGVFD